MTSTLIMIHEEHSLSNQKHGKMPLLLCYLSGIMLEVLVSTKWGKNKVLMDWNKTVIWRNDYLHVKMRTVFRQIIRNEFR